MLHYVFEAWLLVILADGTSLMRSTTPERCLEIAGAVWDGKDVIATTEGRSELVTRAACFAVELDDAECEAPSYD